MIKAYLYPRFFGGFCDNCFYDDENACRVECSLLGIPQIGQCIVVYPVKTGLSEALYQNCLKQLENPKSIISVVLAEFRKAVRGEQSMIRSEKYLEFFKDNYCWKYLELTDKELLHMLLFSQDTIMGFNDSTWIVEYLDMYANDDHLHIILQQEY